MGHVAAALLAARVVLAAVFLVAGVAKLADRAGSRQAMLDFGAPPWLAAPLGTLLPAGELLTAIALLPVATARWGAISALALLALFTAAIARALARGAAPPCRCFGQLAAAPVGPRTLVRNGLLLSIAAFLAVRGWRDPGPGLLGPIISLTLAERLAAAAGAGLLLLGAAVVLLMVEMMRQQGRILLRLDAIERIVATGPAGAPPPAPIGPSFAPPGLPVGAAAPPFRLKDLDGVAVDLGGLLAPGRPVLLLFVHPRCGPCEALMPQIAAWQRAAAGVLTLPLISEGGVRANRAMATQHGVTAVLRQRGSEVGKAYQAYGTPSAVLVHPDGTIASPVAGGADAIRALVESALAAPALSWEARTATWNSQNGQTAGSPSPAGRLRQGDPAPPFALPDLRGKMVRLEDMQGVETLLVSWHPSCGFCAQLLEPLKAWEANTPASARRLLIVARGDAAGMAGAGFRSTVVMDADGALSQACGLAGTPMALLLDARGRVASEVAAGPQAVLQLAMRPAGSRASDPRHAAPAPRGERPS